MIQVEQNRIVFTVPTGQNAAIKLEDLIEDEDGVDVHGLMLFGIFYQLARISNGIGEMDLGTREGSGLMALATQQAATMMEISNSLSTLNGHLEMLAKRVSDAPMPDINKVMGDALKMAKEHLGGMSPAAATVNRPGPGPGTGDGS